MVITGNMAQASFDAFVLPRHVGLYSGVPIEVPAEMVQRVCGTGIEIIMKASDAVSQQRADVALCVGTESMSRNPIAAYTHRSGFRLGQVEFKDFLWEALMDPAASVTMGDTAENLARQYQITRPEVDAYAAQSFERAIAAQKSGFLAGEIAPVKNESFELDELRAARAQAQGREGACHRHPHPPLPARGAGENPPGLRRRADRRQLVGHRRRRGGGAGGFVRLREEVRQGAARPRRRRRGGRRAARDHGHRPGAGHQGGAGARRAQAFRHRPLRDQRGVRRAGHGLRARTRHRRGEAQRQWRRHRHRPPARRDRRAARDHAGARIEAVRARATVSRRPASAAARASPW